MQFGRRGFRGSAGPGPLRVVPYLAITLFMVVLAAKPARAQTALGLPIVVPRESVTLLGMLNRATRFEVLRFSEVTLGDKRVIQTAVVNVIQGGGLFVPPRMVLFLPAEDLALIQQLNQGLPIQPLVLVRMVAFPPLRFVPSALVLISTPSDLPKIGPNDCLLALPGGSINLTVQLNGGGSFSLVRISQVSIGGSGGTSIAYVALRSGGAEGTFTLFIREDDLPELRRMNPGFQFDVVRVTTTTLPGTNVEVRVAQVNVICPP